MRLIALATCLALSQLVFPHVALSQGATAAPPAATPTTPGKAPAQPAPEFKPFEEVTKDTEKLEGFFTLYRNKKGIVYLELKPEQLNEDFLCLVTLESGIGDRRILSGIPMQEWLVQFRRVNDRIHFVQRNAYFRANPDSPIHRAVKRSFSDSILGSFAIESIHNDRKSILVNLNSVFQGDLADLSNELAQALGAPYGLDREKTYLATAKAFPLNIELQTNYVFAAGRGARTDVLPDARSLTIRVHYGISRLPEQTSYRPRLADDRVGYFLTVFKEYSDDARKTAFVRYINRWNVQPAPDGKAKKPIVFWLDNATPLEYRDAIRDGVLFWNKAFDRIGIKEAVQVRQMPDDVDWDPADVRYNVIRWITSSTPSFGAMGPSRVNPLTGEILDADILIEAETVRGIKSYYRRWLSQLGARQSDVQEATNTSQRSGLNDPARLCTYGIEKSAEAAFGGIALFLRDELGAGGVLPDEFVSAYLRDLTAHEVGHTLGLRHNFHASTMLSLKEMHNIEMTKERGITGSVMDYTPINLAPRGVKQGHFFMPTIGPYDEWAIEYGYRPIEATSMEDELPTLKKIASRAPMSELAYATDEDASDFGAPTSIDPLAQRFDMGNDPIAWAKVRVQIVRELLPRMNLRIPVTGESYSEARNTFESLFGAYSNAATVVAKYIGGVYFNRHFAGDPGGKLPFEAVPASRQREALEFLTVNVFSEMPLPITPALLNKLAPERHWHWGVDPTAMRRLDYPLLDRFLTVQRGVLARIYHPLALSRVRDSELRARTPQEVLSLAELFDGIRQAIWTELASSNGKAKGQSGKTIGSVRRALQREHLNLLIRMTTRPDAELPEDARTLAWNDLRILKAQIAKSINGKSTRFIATEALTRAHLQESMARIHKALDARISTDVR